MVNQHRINHFKSGELSTAENLQKELVVQISSRQFWRKINNEANYDQI